MGWSARFAAKLAERNVQPIFVLEGYRWGVSAIQSQWRIASQPIDLALTSAVIVLEGSSVTSAELNVRDSTCALGTITIAFRGSPYQLFALGARRGQMVALKMGFPGDALSAFERIEIATLWNIRSSGSLWVIECRDFGAYLGNRKTTTSTLLAAFASVGSTTPTTASYSVADATVTVASTAAFDKQNDGSGTLKGCIRVEAATPFYLTYTGKTATTFTGVSAAGQFGTTAASASSGTTITEIAYMDDHPIDAMRRVIVSTGVAAANGAYDWLPQSWGYSIPDGFVDHNDCNYYRSASAPASGSDDHDILVEEQQVDGLSWAQSMLSPGGYFVCPHQGSISVRCIVDPYVTSARGLAIIDDSDIVGDIDYEAWSSSDQVEYYAMIIATSSGLLSSTGVLSTWPAEISITRDLTTQVFANESAIRTKLVSRLRWAFLRIPEIVRVRLKGWQWATLSPGDVIQLTSDILSGRSDTTAHGMVRRRALVLGRSPSWFGAPETSIVLALECNPDQVT